MRLMGLLLTLIFAQNVLASNELAQTFTLDGYLYEAGSTTALLDSGAKITIQILDPSKTCVLYTEQQTVDTSTTSGYFNIQVGSIVGNSKRVSGDPGLTMAQVFQNTSSVAATSASGSTCTGSMYIPAADDLRYFRTIVTPSATNVAETLSPDATMGSAPQALVAQTLQGHPATDFLLSTGIPTCSTGTFLTYSGTAFTCGSVSGSSGVGTVTSITAGTGLTGGTITSSGTIALTNSGVTAGTYGTAATVPVISVDIYGRITAVSSVAIASSPSGTASGDLSGSYPSPTVSALSGTPLAVTALAAGQYLQYNGSSWTNSNLTVSSSSITYTSETANTVFAAPNGSTGTPTYRALVAADLPTVTVSKGGTGLSTTPSNGQLLIGTGSGFNLATLTAGTGMTITNSAGSVILASSGLGGTVTSVGLSLPSIFTVTNSPVTSSGTIAVALSPETAGTVLAAPSTAAGTPSFRAIASTDLPTIAISGGGTGATTASAALTNLGAAASGANADITSTSVLTNISSTTSAIEIAPTGNLNLAPTTAVVSSAPFEGPLGTPAAPTFTSYAATSTGMFFPSSSVIGFSVSGTNVMDILSSGAVGIGTTSPLSMLDVAGAIYIHGLQAINIPTTSATSVAVGPSALNASNTGAYNTAIGYRTLAFNTTGAQNATLGYDALDANTTGTGNTAMGATALLSNSTGNSNTAVGTAALTNNQTTSYNTAIGASALFSSTTGSNNTAIGYEVGYSVTTGTGNILIGTSQYVSTPTASTSNFLNIGNLIYATGMNNTSTTSTGNVGIGTTAPAYTLQVNGTIAATSSLVNTSDQRLKKNIQTITGGLDKIAQLRGVTFDWRKSEHPEMKLGDRQELGVIAQEVEKVFPQAVSQDKNTGFKAVAYSMLIGPLIEAVKEVNQLISSQSRDIASLKSENARMKDENAELRQELCKKDSTYSFCKK